MNSLVPCEIDMCLAIPMRIEAIDGEMATVDVAGTRREVSVALLEKPCIGDYVLVHAGFAIRAIDEREAEETVRLLNQMAEAAERPEY